MLFLCQCVGYRQNMRGLLKCKWERIQEHGHEDFFKRRLFRRPTLVNKRAWRRNQRMEFDVVSGKKSHTNDGAHSGCFWANSVKQQRRPISRKGQDKLQLFSSLLICSIVWLFIAWLWGGGIAKSCSWPAGWRRKFLNLLVNKKGNFISGSWEKSVH